MSIYSMYETDAALETKGILLDFGQGAKVRIARAGGENSNFQKRMTFLLKPHRRAIQLDTLDQKVYESLVLDGMLDAVVLGWEGIKDRDGNEIPFNRENAKKLFTELPDFYKAVRESATNQSLFRTELNETDSKNS